MTPRPPTHALPHFPVSVLPTHLLPPTYITLGTRRDCIRLRGLPYEAQVEHILQFLGDHAKSIIFQGVHMVYNAQVRTMWQRRLFFLTVLRSDLVDWHGLGNITRGSGKASQG